MKTALAFDDVLLVPRCSDIVSRDRVDLHTKVCGLPLSLPILSANMATVTSETMARALYKQGGLGVLDRTTIPYHIAADIYGYAESSGIHTVVSIGLNALEHAEFLYGRGVRFMCLDVAHGHHTNIAELAFVLLRDYKDLRLIVGNIATAAAAAFLADTLFTDSNDPSIQRVAFKIGVGSGSLCSTRLMTGFGVPTLQSVLDITEELEKSGFGDISLVADGGIKTSGDIVKCLAAGASAVMLGSLLAGTEEAPGDVIKDDRTGTLYKVYRGSASFGVKKEHKGNTKYLEGAEALIPYKGSVVPVLQRLAEGIRSGLSYNGSTTISQLQVSHEFIRVSSAGSVESSPHGLFRS